MVTRHPIQSKPMLGFKEYKGLENTGLTHPPLPHQEANSEVGDTKIIHLKLSAKKTTYNL